MIQENTYTWNDEQIELANKYYNNINNLIKSSLLNSAWNFLSQKQKFEEEFL